MCIVRFVAFELVARRRAHASEDRYDWHVSVTPDVGAARSLVLAHADRASWPQRVREYGITHLDAVGFTQPEERMLFALDCDF